MGNSKKIVFEAADAAEERWLAKALKDETFGGVLLLAAAILAIFVANSQLSDSYSDFLNTKLEIPVLDLNLSVMHWISDGLLAIFFLVAGLELKHELVHGSLATPSRALVPVTAAIAGMILPIALYVILLRGDSAALEGWAIPMATDIAFALAILAIAGR